MARGPIPHTCPDIDRQQGWNKTILSEIKAMLKGWDEDGAKKLLDDCFDRIDELTDFLEAMRKSNDALRSWGAEKEDECANHESYIAELEKDLSTLQAA